MSMCSLAMSPFSCDFLKHYYLRLPYLQSFIVTLINTRTCSTYKAPRFYKGYHINTCFSLKIHNIPLSIPYITCSYAIPRMENFTNIMAKIY